MSHVLHHVVLAVSPSPTPSPSGTASPTAVPIDPSKVEAGALGLLFFVAMGIAVALLLMSMKRHLGRVDVTRHQREKKTPGPPPA
jgi:hypothetical protein